MGLKFFKIVDLFKCSSPVCERPFEIVQLVDFWTLNFRILSRFTIARLDLCATPATPQGMMGITSETSWKQFWPSTSRWQAPCRACGWTMFEKIIQRRSPKCTHDNHHPVHSRISITVVKSTMNNNMVIWWYLAIYTVFLVNKEDIIIQYQLTCKPT